MKKSARPAETTTLQLIWKEREISRAEIARRTGLSRSTVSEVMATLLESGLVSEIGMGPSSGGRRPIVLRFQDDACCILGIEIGSTHVAVALTDLQGHVIAWVEENHDTRSDPAGTRALIARLGQRVLEEGGSGRPLLGIGVAVPSPVHPTNPDWVSEVVLPEWKGHLGLSGLRKRLGAPLFVDNDANLGALAEQWWGAGRDQTDFAYIKIGTGVGSGHVVAGEIYRGSTGVAGEIGHLSIDAHGEPCICGLNGCLATLVGAPALVSRVDRLRDQYPDSVLHRAAPSIPAIEEAALAGDPLALRIVEEAGQHLGIAVAGMLNLMNPNLVILGGGLARLGERILDPLRRVVRQRTLVSSLAASEIRTSTLGPRTSAIGAATLVLKWALDDWSRFPTPLPVGETPLAGKEVP